MCKYPYCSFRTLGLPFIEESLRNPFVRIRSPQVFDAVISIMWYKYRLTFLDMNSVYFFSGSAFSWICEWNYIISVCGARVIKCNGVVSKRFSMDMSDHLSVRREWLTSKRHLYNLVNPVLKRQVLEHLWPLWLLGFLLWFYLGLQDGGQVRKRSIVAWTTWCHDQQ